MAGESKPKKAVSIILATDNKGGIGKGGQLPWRLSQDMQYFKEVTSITLSPSKKNAVVMGRKTWESIPEKYRPLPGRENVILTKDSGYKAQAIVFNSLSTAIEKLNERDDIETIFIIGGATLYNESVDKEIADRIYLTKVLGDFDCDTFFTGVPGNYKLEGISDKVEENGIIYQWLTYEKNQGQSTSKLKILNQDEVTF